MAILPQGFDFHGLQKPVAWQGLAPNSAPRTPGEVSPETTQFTTTLENFFYRNLVSGFWVVSGQGFKMIPQMCKYELWIIIR